MASHIRGELYAVTTLEPVNDYPDDWVVYCTLPVDIDVNDNPDDTGRYVSVIGVPPEIEKSDVIFRRLSCFRPISVNWLSYFWKQVA